MPLEMDDNIIDPLAKQPITPLGRLIKRMLARPILFWILIVSLMVMGIVALRMLPIEAYPELANPQVRVITLFPGKGAEEVERLVTVPLERELNGIPGQTAMRSISIYGLSVITVVFQQDTNTLLARSQVMERIAQAPLPEGAEAGMEPDVGSLREIYRYTLQSPYYSPMSLRAIQEWEMEKAFRQIPGVVGVVSEGGPTKTYQVNVDPVRLAAYNISLSEVFEALSNSNTATGGNYIEKNREAYIVRGLGWLTSETDIAAVPIRSNAQGVPIRVGDVASVEIGPRVRMGQTGLNYEDDVVQGIVLLRRGENPSKVLDRIYQELPRIQERLPHGVELVPLYDRSELIAKTLETVSENMILGILLVIMVLSFFFLDIRAALITASVIPLSVLFAFINLNIWGIPANLLSLGAIDFGILVDGAVVMTENIVRHLSGEGRSMTPAQRITLLAKAAGEVGRPVILGILTIIVSFLPIFTFQGVEGRLFQPLAVTMVTALVGAGLLALTLIPVLCAFFLTKKPILERKNPVIHFVRFQYAKGLRWALSHSFTLISSAVMSFIVAIVIFLNMGSEFLPHLEEGNIWLRATIKPGSVTLDESVNVAKQVRTILLEYPEVKLVLSQAGGPDDGTDPHRFADHEYLVDLHPSHIWRPQFKRNKERLISAMQTDLEQIPNVDYYFTQYIQTTLDESLSGVQGSLVAKIAGPDLAVLERLANQIGPIMRDTAGIVDVIVDPLLGQPQLSIAIDRQKAARYGLNVSDLSDLVEIAIGGRPATEVIEGEKRFEVMVRSQATYRSDEAALANFLVDTPSGQKIPLAQFATLQTTTGATQIWREAGHRLATIRANVRGRDLATSVKEAQQRVNAEVQFPEGYYIDWSGEFQRQREASAQMNLVLPITLLIILTILFITFHDIRSALIVFCVVPMAAIGGILGLFVTGTYFSIAAGVGFIALFGVAIQNAIIMISFVRQLQAGGMSIQMAVYKGAMTRMRPVLMTALVAMLGLLPAAISTEIGAQTQKPFAIVIIFGLASATVMTLLVLPVLYKTFAVNKPLISREVD